ncbi:helix-turn-helix domain-containing protein [Dokdonia donghaensis]|uniref:AraC family transcriptional regulator n=1 Tax=Dokdonia donghaensis DSW-1 TaxID=1300343 RepID=A0A0A2GYX1_9FLAO|nr:helix-turn-helix transcriptional regulator [Dokdonia donghaensis]ANH60249.1 Arabinose operon regulatory protein [Dokdonia donghaensis DSW-1]KGO07536.1 AraC family transcriptional regulator [Dokdonia donghaensis DSW-1]
MKKIPNISFKGEDNEKDFELLSLTDFFTMIPTIKDHDPMRPHRVNFFVLLIVIEGTGTHQIDLKEYSLKAGTVLKIAKGQVHAFQKKPTYKGYLIVFTEAFLLNYFSKSSINLISHFYNYYLVSPITYNKGLNEALLNQLIPELKIETTFGRKNIVASLLDLYLLRLERSVNSSLLLYSESKNYTKFIQFKNLVEVDFTSTRNVKDYAQKMLVSTKFLNQIVKEFTLNTAKSFIDNLVILEAKREIVSLDKSVKEIAFDIGFDEVTNFTKFFKNRMGVTPNEFRKAHLY